MIRCLVFLLACLLAAPSFAGQLRTGRGVRHFHSPVAASGSSERAGKRVVYRTVTWRRNQQQAESPAAEDQAAPTAEQPRPLQDVDPATEPQTEPALDAPNGASHGAVAPASEYATLGESWLGGCGGCDQCKTCGNYWFDSDILFWSRRGQAPPALAATNTLPAGEILFGASTVGDDLRVGGRFELGGYLHYDQMDSINGRFWSLGQAQVVFDSGDLDPTVSVIRPFIDVEDGSVTFNQEIGLPINNIGGSTGSMRVVMDANVWGGDVLWRHRYYRSCNAKADILFGYHGSRVDEDIVIDQSFSNSGVQFDGRDIFSAKNDFHGVVLGLQVVSHQGPWTIDMLAKIALGDMHQRVYVDGWETRDDGVTEETTTGSLLALPTNIGRGERNKFAVVPELAIESRWQCRENVELTAGYTYVFWSDVMQAGELIDRTINGSQTSGGALNGVRRPAPPVFQDGTYWVHGFNLGLTWTY